MHQLPWHGFYHSSPGFVTSKMKFLTTLALLLALQVCAPRAQVGRDAAGKKAKGYAVVLTKSAEDELVRNRDRAVVANRAGAALMVRLHCDASVERGFAVYYPDRQGRTKDGAAVGP